MCWLQESFDFGPLKVAPWMPLGVIDLRATKSEYHTTDAPSRLCVKIEFITESSANIIALPMGCVIIRMTPATVIRRAEGADMVTVSGIREFPMTEQVK